MRFGGRPKDEISTGVDFLNYGITWDAAEKVFEQLSEDKSLCSLFSALFRSHEKLSAGPKALIANSSLVKEVQQ
jgi:hypothetical protein